MRDRGERKKGSYHIENGKIRACIEMVFEFIIWSPFHKQIKELRHLVHWHQVEKMNNNPYK